MYCRLSARITVVCAALLLAFGHPSLASPMPDETGRIPILMYHGIGEKHRHSASPYDRHGWNISPDTLRRQLQQMYDAGWYPVNMRDVVSARIAVPAGKTPVVLTFDDARATQFRYLPDGRIDPNCAVGILEAFHASHPDWLTRASFYILPDSKWNPVPFGQRGRDTEKLRFLVEHGYEIANHSTSHHPFTSMSASRIRWELAQCQRYVRKRVPAATMDTFALPYGAGPRDPALWSTLFWGRDGGTIYHHSVVLLAGGDPAYPPTDRKFNPRRVMRLGAEPGFIEGWICSLRRGKPLRPYVSDGDPTVVTVPWSEAAHVDRHRLVTDGQRLVVYGSAPVKARPVRTALQILPGRSRL